MNDPPRAPRTLTTPDGETLALHAWPLPPGQAKAVVVWVHGIGEHAGRYQRVGEMLDGWGFEVPAADHHGHGASSGARGGIDR